MLWILGSGFVFLCEGYLREWRVGSKGVFRILWRYLLIWARCLMVPGRCRGDGLRSVATRRHTLRTGAVLQTDYLEKTGLFLVKTWNKWLVFQCTVNWSRARLT